MKLYAITEEMQEIQNLVDSGELTQGEVNDTLDYLKMEQKTKLKSILKLRQSIAGENAAVDEEIKRLTDIKKSNKAREDELKNYIAH